MDLIIQSLPDSFGQFIMNYHMNKTDSILPELLNKLVIAEDTLKDSKSIVLTVKRAFSKRKSTWKKKKKLAKKQEVPKKAVNKKKYFHYNVEGH